MRFSLQGEDSDITAGCVDICVDVFRTDLQLIFNKVFPIVFNKSTASVCINLCIIQTPLNNIFLLHILYVRSRFFFLLLIELRITTWKTRGQIIAFHPQLPAMSIYSWFLYNISTFIYSHIHGSVKRRRNFVIARCVQVHRKSYTPGTVIPHV